MSYLVTWSLRVEDASSVEEAALKAYRKQRMENAATAKFAVHTGTEVVEDVTLSPSVSLDLLTTREGEVARLVALGASNADIAKEMEITPRTVKAHVSHIFEKFGVENRVSLASKMIRIGKTEELNAVTL